MSYEAWRATFQNPEQAAKSAYKDTAEWYQKFNQADQENTELKAKLSSKNEAIIDAVKAARKSWAKSGTPVPIIERELGKFDLFSLAKLSDDPPEYSLKTVIKCDGSERSYLGLGELDKILAEAIRTAMDGEA